MGKPRPGGFAMPVPAESLARLVAARECGATVQDLARRWDRSPAWIRTTLQQMTSSSSDVPHVSV